MKNKYMFKHLLIIILSVSIALLSKAQSFQLIDINRTRNANPVNYQFAQKNMFAVLKGIFYFTADDGVHGNEFFASDGTAKGTKLIKDILPGAGSSNVLDIIVCQNKLYFLASDTLNKQKIWVSDGTNAGTRPLNNITSSLGFSQLLFLTAVNGSVYFSYSYYDYNFNYRNQLWKTDSSGLGAVELANFTGSISQMVGVNNRLFFTFYDYNSDLGSELYTSDGTTAGTKLVANINTTSYAGSNPSHLAAVNGLLYFAADDGTGNKLWVSDGSVTGTQAVKNNHNIYLFPDGGFGTDPFAIKDNYIFFQGYSFDSATLSSTGYELCKYNSYDTLPGVELVKDIAPGEKGSYPYNITNVSGTLFFTSTPGNNDAQLWKSDGTGAGTVLVKNINPGGKNNYYGLTDVNGTLLFSYGNDSLGTELWKSDGTAPGTVLIKDIYPGSPGSSPYYLTPTQKFSLFNANSPGGLELWRTDGTDSGTVLVKDINYKTTSSSYPFGFTRLKNNKIVFSAYNGKTSGNLFVTNGTAAGTKAVDSITSLQRMFNTNEQFAVFKNEAYFTNYSGHIFKTDGTKAGTSVLAIPEVIDPQSGYITNLVATENYLYIFTYNYKISQVGLWRTDGSAAGTIVLKTDISGQYQSFPTMIGNNLFFASFKNNTGGELWKTDGTVAGTKLVKVVGSYNYNPLTNLYAFNGRLYFTAYTPANTNGPVLWTSDGTDAGTFIVKDVAIIQQPFAQANGKLFFYAFDPLYGYELFVSDGTTAGTHIVKDINKDNPSSNVYLYPSSLISGDTLLYFIANDGVHGTELWKSNGTAGGTKQLKDLTPGIDGSYFNFAVNIHDHLFFTVNDKLWQSDGTKANTHFVNDENLKEVTQLNNLTAIGDSLYFSGYTYATGEELYAGSAEIKLPAVTLAIADSIQTYTAPANITFNAVATDEDGVITRVEFYNGTTLLHTEFKYPYTFVWSNIPAGVYTITARATDNNGNLSTSNSITVLIEAPQLRGIAGSITGKIDANNLPGFLLTPNPAHNILQVLLTGWQPGAATISVISAGGVAVRSWGLKNVNGLIQLDISSLAGGIHTVKFVSGKKVIYKQFIKL